MSAFHIIGRSILQRINNIPHRTCGITYQILRTPSFNIQPKRLLQGVKQQLHLQRDPGGNKSMFMIYQLSEIKGLMKYIIPIHYWFLVLSIPAIVLISYSKVNEKLDGEWWNVKKFLAAFLEAINRDVDKSEFFTTFTNSVDIFMIILPGAIVLFVLLRLLLNRMVTKMYANRNRDNFKIVTYGWSMLPKQTSFKLSDIQDIRVLFQDTATHSLKIKNKQYVLLDDSFIDKQCKNLILYQRQSDSLEQKKGKKSFLRK